MDKTQITQTATDASELFKVIMKLYWSYLDDLEETIKHIPDNQTDALNDLLQHMGDVQMALEHDVAVFDKALQEDLEDVGKLKDQLKINDIYKNLEKK